MGNKVNCKVRKPGKVTVVPETGLTTKMQAFVDEYIVDFNATQAAIRAGYSGKNASNMACKLLGRPDVAEAVAKAMEERSKRTKIDQDWVLKQAVEVHNRCMQGAPVLHPDGTPVLIETPVGEIAPAYRFDSGGALKALEIVGKHVDVQAFRESVDHNHKGKVDMKWTMEIIPGKPKPADA